MVSAICQKKGDVIKFAGDAILVGQPFPFFSFRGDTLNYYVFNEQAIFPADSFEGDLVNALVCSSNVALELIGLDLSSSGAALSVHCGLGCGDVTGYNVGGVGGRWEYVIIGSPVEQIGSAEPEAKAGEVVLSREAHAMMSDFSLGEILPSGNFNLKSLLTETRISDTVRYEKSC
jgi:class 3 adenylate cyclase